MTSATETSSASNQRDLFCLLDADNIKTVEETKALIHENLHSSRDPGLLHAMVEYYLKTRSPACLQILSGIHEARAQALFEKMNDSLKHRTTRLVTLTLLGHIVRKQPSWLHKIIKTPLFDTLLKCLKVDTDAVVLESAVLIITTMLPMVPVSIGPWLPELFEIFTRLSSYRAHGQGNAPEVYLLHLHVAVYMFFHRLYAMYPNNFLMYLRTLNNEPSKKVIFQDYVKPMLEYVRVHPCVITETAQTETDKHRWKQKEAHDIVIECMKVSLDPIDRIQEKGNFLSSSMHRHSCQELYADKSITSILTASWDSEGLGLEKIKERRMSDSATQTGKSLQSGDSGTDSCSLPVVSSTEIASGWSTSGLCQLNTPPSSRMSPSTSNPDLTSSLTCNIHSHCSTPAGVYTPGQSPTASLGEDVAYPPSYSSSPSISGSRGKIGSMAGIYNDRATLLKGSKAATSQEGQLARALFSALTLQSQQNHKSAPAAIMGHQSSTPNKCQEDGKIESAVETSHEMSNVSHTSSITSFEAHGEETKGSVRRTSLEKIDSGTFNVLPKEEFRDSSEEGDYPLEVNQFKPQDARSVETNAGFLSGSLTAMAGQTLDAGTSPNLADEYKLLPENTCSSKEINVSHEVMVQSCCENDGLISSTQLEDELGSTISLDKGQCHAEASKKETSVASSDASCDLSKCQATIPASQPNHHGFVTSDVFAGFPQLLHWIRGELDCSNFNAESDEPSFSRPQFSAMSCRASPVEILDNYLKTGSSIHHGELSRVPLVSQAGTCWTHFGGKPPVDEVEILRGQVKLLHNQLLFERHKCDLHAIRNRRLIGKTFKAVQYQEELQATKDQLRLQEDKMRELTEALNQQMEESRKYKSLTSGWENHQRIELQNLLNENAQLKYKEKELLEKFETQQRDYDSKHVEVHQLKAKIFTLENELERLKVESSEKDHLTKQVNHLVKEVLLLGELNQQHKDTIKKLTLTEAQHPESSMHLKTCHRELTVAKQTVKWQKAELEALTSKLADVETVVSNKDNEIRDMKKFIEGLKGTCIGKIQSLEEKYNAQKKVTQALESYILDVQAVESARKEKIASEKLQPES